MLIANNKYEMMGFARVSFSRSLNRTPDAPRFNLPQIGKVRARYSLIYNISIRTRRRSLGAMSTRGPAAVESRWRMGECRMYSREFNGEVVCQGCESNEFVYSSTEMRIVPWEKRGVKS